MRYFFDIIDAGGRTDDMEGMILGSFNATRQEAKRTLATIAAEEPFAADDLLLSMRVRDETNVQVYDLCLEMKGRRLRRVPTNN